MRPSFARPPWSHATAPFKYAAKDSHCANMQFFLGSFELCFWSCVWSFVCSARCSSLRSVVCWQFSSPFARAFSRKKRRSPYLGLPHVAGNVSQDEGQPHVRGQERVDGLARVVHALPGEAPEGREHGRRNVPELASRVDGPKNVKTFGLPKKEALLI